MRLWGVIYPVALYVVVTNIVMFLLNLVWKQTDENYLIFHIITTVTMILKVISRLKDRRKRKTWHITIYGICFLQAWVQRQRLY